MDSIFIFIAEYFIFFATILAVLYVLFMHERRNHLKHVAIIVGSAVLAWTLGHFLKDIIAHPRPDLALALIQPNDPYSFPSGHASFMFALAFAVYFYNKKAGMTLLLFALLTGVARVMVGVHYWYDIAGGAILGYVVSFIVIAVFQRKFLK